MSRMRPPSEWISRGDGSSRPAARMVPSRFSNGSGNLKAKALDDDAGRSRSKRGAAFGDGNRTVPGVDEQTFAFQDERLRTAQEGDPHARFGGPRRGQREGESRSRGGRVHLGVRRGAAGAAGSSPGGQPWRRPRGHRRSLAQIVHLGLQVRDFVPKAGVVSADGGLVAEHPEAREQCRCACPAESEAGKEQQQHALGADGVTALGPPRPRRRQDDDRPAHEPRRRRGGAAGVAARVGEGHLGRSKARASQ